ncbi:metallophosphoesterase family protein [Streptomyces pinistramenti]|uniref:metallophosphoesterase family protein n=1 Tax=Streptomyces pinistramenti TaxID=2884812 RepID=UPI001D0625EF|nr:metallophosphoesterase [Streptomyces pinistramenti]MCB5912409.1 metallophosphoesterase [Streptomyces pinistramenti]
MSLLAVSDLHVRHRENRAVVEGLRPTAPQDWLVIAGDTGELSTDIAWALGLLAERFATVVWAPGNHDLWTLPGDPLQARGADRYAHLVELCRSLGIHTPEDPYPLWPGPEGPVAVAPLFLGYDYTFTPPDAPEPAQALAAARREGVVCTDEFLLHPHPHPSRAAWCRRRVEYTAGRLEALGQDLPTVLVNHYPLLREPTRILRHPRFALWCGTRATADWHRRFRSRAVVYGHLHVPRTTWHDGVPFHEVSLGYPREWRPRPGARSPLTEILPGSSHPLKEAARTA